ncbi:uncharacterized protein LOC121379518 [Gigantopelta aegis]|uniref:uncharacterized protein LOC121379518 n=1 Tax=Gigantopelta aegis TaxID=1735272 RepID=UPI001B887E04|nr:uncharacterized protein LOC121379518 [Gigantopelta aegis]
MDRTFSSCPPLWNQPYILHARSGFHTYPLVSALQPDRQITIYVRFFDNLKTHVQQVVNRPLDPQLFQTDFEIAAIRAVQQVFPHADARGVFFHFCQAVWRKTQNLGLAVLYKNDPTVGTWIRRAACLPLLPIPEVQDTWLEAMNQFPDVPTAIEMNDYMVTN